METNQFDETAVLAAVTALFLDRFEGRSLEGRPTEIMQGFVSAIPGILGEGLTEPLRLTPLAKMKAKLFTHFLDTEFHGRLITAVLSEPGEDAKVVRIVSHANSAVRQGVEALGDLATLASVISPGNLEGKNRLFGTMLPEISEESAELYWRGMLTMADLLATEPVCVLQR